MITVNYVEHGGATHAVQVEPGLSLMKGAVLNNVPGIVAECGGACACATCHVYVPPEWQTRLPPAQEQEVDMLECASEVRGNSRLACQIALTPELDGLMVHLPASQY